MGKFSALSRRVLIAVFYVPLMLFFFIMGGYYLKGFLTLIAIVSIFEILNNLEFKKFLAIPVLYSVYIQIFVKNVELFFYLLTVFIFLSPLVIHYFDKDQNTDNLKRTLLFILVFILINCGAFFISRFRQEFGWNHAVFILISIWIYDNFAYFSGLIFGKNKIFGPISPQKTLEGMLGGLICNFILGGILGFILFVTTISQHSIREFIYLGSFSVFIGLLAQFGDLFESLIKRCLNIKDFSNILSAHGGVMDRFDSVLFTFPIVYIIYNLRL